MLPTSIHAQHTAPCFSHEGIVRDHTENFEQVVDPFLLSAPRSGSLGGRQGPHLHSTMNGLKKLPSEPDELVFRVTPPNIDVRIAAAWCMCRANDSRLHG